MPFVSSVDDPDLPAPPWATKRDRPARVRLSRTVIGDAALEIVDRDGLSGLNMRRLAEALGTGPASLYAHVSGKDELLAMLIDRVAGEMELPEPDPARWQEQLKEAGRAMRAVLAAHRDLAAASIATIPTGPNAMAAMDGILGILRAGRLPDQIAAWAGDLLSEYVTMDAYETSLFLERLEHDPEYFERLAAYIRALPAGRFPHVAALAQAMVDDEGADSRFEFGLDVLVRGLASFAEAEPAPPPGAAAA
jgi:AcrR family transcriptional regulator